MGQYCFAGWRLSLSVTLLVFVDQLIARFRSSLRCRNHSFSFFSEASGPESLSIVTGQFCRLSTVKQETQVTQDDIRGFSEMMCTEKTREMTLKITRNDHELIEDQVDNSNVMGSAGGLTSVCVCRVTLTGSSHVVFDDNSLDAVRAVERAGVLRRIHPQNHQAAVT